VNYNLDERHAIEVVKCRTVLTELTVQRAQLFRHIRMHSGCAEGEEEQAMLFCEAFLKRDERLKSVLREAHGVDKTVSANQPRKN